MTVLKSEAVAAVPAIPVGMKPWHGGDSAPADYDPTKPIMFRSGSMPKRAGDGLDWTHGATNIRTDLIDIIAYTPTSLPVQEERVRELVERLRISSTAVPGLVAGEAAALIEQLAFRDKPTEPTRSPECDREADHDEAREAAHVIQRRDYDCALAIEEWFAKIRRSEVTPIDGRREIGLLLVQHRTRSEYDREAIALCERMHDTAEQLATDPAE